MRVIFFGTGDFAVPILERLVENHYPIVLCVTQPDRPQGRGLQTVACPVKQVALRLQLPLAQPEGLSCQLCEDRPSDIGIAVDYGRLIPADLLDFPQHGILGVHPSLLPKYRGASPIPWSILQGEEKTGVSIFRLAQGLDAGPIASQQTIAIEPAEDAASLARRLAILGAQQLLGVLALFSKESVSWSPQDDSQASYAPKLTKEQGRVDWRQPAVSIERLVRAMNPWPCAYTTWKTTLLKIWKVEVASHRDAPHSFYPGTVTAATAHGITVMTGKETVILKEVQPAGKRRMHAQEFLAGHPVQVGEQLV